MITSIIQGANLVKGSLRYKEFKYIESAVVLHRLFESEETLSNIKLKSLLICKITWC
jgi:hypothetical protein